MSDPSERRFLDQVQQIKEQLDKQEGLPFQELLDVEMVQQVLEEVDFDFRARIYDPYVVTCMMLSQVLSEDCSCSNAVSRLIAQRAMQGKAACSPNTGSYCTARGRLPEEVLRRLMQRIGQGLHDQAAEPWKWKGRSVKVVDGSTLSMPDTEENQQAYPQSKSQKPGLGFPIVRLVVVFSLAVGTTLQAALGRYQGKQMGETALLRSISDVLSSGDVLTGDRYYCTYADIALWQQGGVDVVLRKHQLRTTDFRRGRRLGKHDHLVTWSKPQQRPEWMDAKMFASLPEELTLREVKIDVRQKGLRVKQIIVITTLLDAKQYRRDEIGDLYRARWNAELDLRSLKCTLKMDVLRGETPAMVRKEIFAHLLAYNLIRTLMAQAASYCDIAPRTISFKGTLQTFNAFRDAVMYGGRMNNETIAIVLASIAYRRVGNRPDRYEPRAVKRRPKPHDILTVPRQLARKRVA